MQLPKEQSIRSKLGSILGIGSSRSTPVPQRSLDELGKLEHNTFFTADILRELDSSLPLQRRVRALKENVDVVTHKRLEEHAVEAIWVGIKDMIEPLQPIDVRQYTLKFLRNMIYGQFEDLGVLRAHFMMVVKNHNVTEDARLRLDILCVLTQNGRNIQHLEESVGPFLQSWMPEIVTLGHSKVFLQLLINFVHYNAAYLDGDVLIGVVRTTCILAGRSQNSEILVLCLNFINAVVCYSSLPSECLVDIVTTLCQMLNIEKMAKQCLEVMLKLLGTHLGRSAIYSMCTILQERSGESSAYLLRGAVFFVSMSLWGIRKVENLDVTFASVLPSIRQSVLSHQTLVVFEAALSLRRLVRTYGHQLNLLEWDSIYDIMEGIQAHLRLLKERTGQAILSPKNTLGQCQLDLFLAIEDCYDGGRGISIGEPDKFFDLVEDNFDALPLKSVLTLVSYRTSSIDSGGMGLVEKVAKLMEKFYVHGRRSAVKIAVLKYLSRLMDEASSCYEGELMQQVVQRYLQGVARDPDVDVRCHSAQLLVQLLIRSSSKWSTLVLALINSILQYGLEVASKQKKMAPLALQDSKSVVYGLTQAFKEKLHSSSPVAAQILSMLVVLLQQHYEEGYFFPAVCEMRLKIFGCILSLRSNEYYQLGFLDEGSISYSPFYVCRQSGRATDQDLKISPMLLDYRSTFSAVLACLEKECNWDVLAHVLELLRSLLQDRVLTLSAQPDLSPLCQSLCNLVGGQKPRLRSLKVTSTSMPRGDPSSLVYPVLATLTTYPSHLDRKAQHSLVFCLNYGMVGSCAQLCISSLTLCSLELQATMTHVLPHILFRMNQVAATPAMAVPVLEFLSNLIPIPALYSGFVDQEYLSVFAIALPYTNHHKYSTYVVSMAHRVVAQWFVNCRMHYRPVVANFVCKKLSSNLEEVLRSHSNSPVKSVRGDSCVGVEMMEVCMDMMARYTYSNLSTLPSRNSGSDFLVSGGPSKSWLVGNSLVTITTSVTRGNLCKFCLSNKTNLDTSSPAASGYSAPKTLSDYLGACTCQNNSWAEIKIRRPAGNTGWMMHLQNRPHPLSLTHPSTHSIPQSNISLLSTSLPAEKLSAAADIEKELFYSREVGSFTDISFLSSLSADLSATENKDKCSKEGAHEQSSGVSVSEEAAVKTGKDDPASMGKVEETKEEEINSVRELVESVEEKADCSKPEEEVEPYIQEEDSTGEATDGEMSLKDISETYDDDALMVGTPQDSDSDEPISDTSPSSPRPSHLGRPANSKSWSESSEASPLGILHEEPRASSLSYAMDFLPPLFSYDEGSEFGLSPSLFEGEKPISDEEQLSLHASLNDILGREAPTPKAPDEEESLSGSGSTGSTEVSATPLGEDRNESDIDIGHTDTTTDSKEEKKYDKEATTRPPRIRNKSLSMPEQSSISNAEAAVASGDGGTAADQGPPDQQSPAANRRQSAPVRPTSSPNPGASTSPLVNKKKLMYSRRPFSASIGQNNASRISSGAYHKEDEFNNPSFIFLQLYNSHCLGDQKDLPILVPANETTERAIKVLDHIPPYETHKLGVVYIKKGQATELQILSNTFGSSRYLDFLRGLGPIMKLSDIPPDMIYLGGLDQSGTDGDFTYCFHDDITQVVYHVATMMPSNLEADPSCSNKKLHIGNDFVTIVYNDSGTEYKFGTIKGQFNYVEVVIEPLLEGVNQVSLHAKPGLEGMLQMSPVCVSDSCLPLLVRQKALQANLASIAYASMSSPGIASALDCNLSNWLARLQHIKKIQEKCHREDQSLPTPHNAHGNVQTTRTSRSNVDADRGGNASGSSSSFITNFTNFS